MNLVVRPAMLDDLAQITAIYNHYVLTTPITFDIEPYTVDKRRSWFDSFASSGRRRLIVAEDGDRKVLGYAGTLQFRDKRAYDTSVETTIYCAPEATGKGIGRRMYLALFEAIKDEDIHRILAGITVPNPQSIALHQKLGFKQVALFSEVGRKFDRYWDVVWMERGLRG